MPTLNRRFVQLTISSVDAPKIAKISILQLSAGHKVYRETSARAQSIGLYRVLKGQVHMQHVNNSRHQLREWLLFCPIFT